MLHADKRLYEPGGKLKQLTDRKGQVSGVTYDAMGRTKTIGYGATSAAPTAYTSTVTLTWDNGNRLTQMVDSVSGTTTRTYDDLDRLLSEVTPQGEVDYTYDKAGNRKTLVVKNGPAGSQVAQPKLTYYWDAANRLTTITQAAGASNNNVQQLTWFGYDDANRLNEVDYSNGVVVTYGYTDADELRTITQLDANGANLATTTYTYDAAGRRVNESGDYTGQRKLPSSVTDALYNANNQLTRWLGSTYSYDLNGNLVSDGSKTYEWNERNQLKSVNSGALASFQYDAQGRRIAKTVSGVLTGYVFDGDNFVQELNGTANTSSVKANLITGGIDQLFMRSVNGSGGATLSWPLMDGNNNVMQLTDSTSAMSQFYTYEPYGKTNKLVASEDNSQQFAGRENDGATGLYFNRNRYYMPATGRFASEDPIGWSFGQTNNYGYVGDDPISYVDPHGTKWWSPSPKPTPAPPKSPIPVPRKCADISASLGECMACCGTINNKEPGGTCSVSCTDKARVTKTPADNKSGVCDA